MTSHGSVRAGANAEPLPKPFRALQASEAISSFGSEMTLIAFPALAVMATGASPSQIALLSGSQFVLVFVVTPWAGNYADGHQRAPLLVLAHYARSALLAGVVILGVADLLTYPVLFCCGVLMGAFTGLFDTVRLAYIPDTVPRDQVVVANSRLASVYAVSQTGGPALGGLAVSAAGPLVALAGDALSYLFGGYAIQRYGCESRPARAVSRGLGAGLRMVWRSDPLRRLVAAGTLFNVAEQVALASIFVAVVTEAGRSVTVLGLGFSAAGVGGVVGARLSMRRGGGDTARSWIWSLVAAQIALVAAMWAIDGPGPGYEGVFYLTLCCYGASLAYYNVHALTRRQLLAPAGALARVNATYRLFAFGAIPVGSGLAAALLATMTAAEAASAVSLLAVVATVLLLRGGYSVPQPERVGESA
ncbi:MAG: MFS transporter [Nocardioides sp.]